MHCHPSNKRDCPFDHRQAAHFRHWLDQQSLLVGLHLNVESKDLYHWTQYQGQHWGWE